ncbi:helix-turn-helix domain-containing protein [Streptomyces bottropensis]|uniref:helix-turn-helix domain-containing protein n=1 Tax=Streptomyces bottropensis TaxID=42235 RepID=UPI0036961E1B
MTDATPTLAQRFAAVVVPAAERAGYTGHGRKARLARATGMTESSIGRMWNGQAIPEPEFFEAIAAAVSLHPAVLFVEAGLMSRESLQSLSETDRSQVGSDLTPEEVADGLGIQDEVGRQMFFATIDRLRRLEDEPPADHTNNGGAAAQM